MVEMRHPRAVAVALATATALAVFTPATAASAAQATLARLTPGGPGPETASITKSLNLTPHDVRLAEGGLAIVVLLAVILVLRVRRRRRGVAASAPKAATHAFPTTDEAWRGSGLVEESTGRLPAFHQSEVVIPGITPGWHEMHGDRSKLGYWDGSRWTAQLEWDGHQWVDPAAVRA